MEGQGRGAFGRRAIRRAAGCGAVVAGMLAALAFPAATARAAALGPGPEQPVEISSVRLARDTVGLFEPSTGRWHLRDTEGDVASFFFGNPGDVPFVGDWDCDGVDTPGLYRASDGFVYLRNSNSQGTGDIEFYFGDPGDVPVAGDFDGDGCDSVAVFRAAVGRVYLIDRLGDAGRGLGVAERWIPLGDPGDRPIAGDLDGDGVDTVGVHRAADATVHLAGRSFVLGNPGDRMVLGDWSGTIAAQAAVFRPGESRFYFFDEAGAVEQTLDWGGAGTIPLAGAFGDLAPGAEPIASDADPLGLVPWADSLRVHSLGTDAFAVWRCHLPDRTSPYGDTAIAAVLNGPVLAWFERWSGDRYRPTFTLLGTLEAPTRNSCLSAAKAATPAGFDAALVVTDDDLSGVATPGPLCTGISGCVPTAYPENGRVAMVGAATMVRSPATVVHEIGHTLHWPHSRSGASGDPYDNPMDVMSGTVRMVIPGTVAFNRYQAGWLDPDDVAVFGGESLALAMGVRGAAGPQLLVIPTGVPGRFYAAGARIAGIDDAAPASGVEVYLVDQTCGTPGASHCIGAASTRFQTPASPDETGHVITPGRSIVVGDAEIRVVSGDRTGFRLVVTPQR